MSPTTKRNFKVATEWSYRGVALFFLVQLYNQNAEALKKIDAMEISQKVSQMQAKDDRRDIDKASQLIVNYNFECVKRNDETRDQFDKLKSQIFSNPYNSNHH